MTPALWASLIGAVVLLLTNTAALIKVFADNAKIKMDRAETKSNREKDSRELHDEVLELRFKYSSLKDAQQLQDEKLNDVTRQSSFIVKEVAILATKIDNLLELVKEGRSNANKAS